MTDIQLSDVLVDNARLMDPMDLTPVFTTSEPDFMADSSARNDDFVRRFDNYPRDIFPRPSAPNHRLMKDGSIRDGIGPKRLTLYLHGTLEDLLGFDIPVFLAGAIEDKPRQKVRVWNYAGTVCYNATLVMEERKERYYGLIVLSSEVSRTAAILPRCGSGS